ncbi:MAG: EI24 domain-containing protein [Hydrotalea flava]|nr:EI24 domain-containing protein [Hydrotalea flava]
MLKEIIIAVQAYFKAHQFIQQHRLWKWIIIPGILYALLFAASMGFFLHTTSGVIEWLSLKTGLKTWLDKMQSTWLGFLFTLSSLGLLLIQMLFYFSFFKYFYLIVGSPVFAYLSEKTEAIINHQEYPFSLRQLGTDMWRGIRLAIRNALWQTVYLIALLILSIIPLFGLITPIIALFIEGYYYGFSMLDYSMGRHNKTMGESTYYIATHKGLAIGNGLIFYIMHLLLFVGWVLAPAYAVVAATLALYPLHQTEAPTIYFPGKPPSEKNHSTS